VHTLVVADLTEHIGEGFEHSVREIFLPGSAKMIFRFVVLIGRR
jgi:hypothetical protein